ncbi:MAG: hypothetical protein E6Q97_29290 [Desulfurellales bacterium]|nr:MAG: hypothetical protein E6Q97_29290 [Desulfurellales bacterium]
MMPFAGFAPDIVPTADGVLPACMNIVPTLKGLKGIPSAIDTALPALASECRGIVLARKLDGSTRAIAGTQTKLYDGTSGTSWTDVSRAGNYIGGAENLWRFCQFGDATIATNRTDAMQASTAGAFADIATAPKASIVETVSGFVMAFDTSDGTYGDSPDRWWCSALYDHTSWTPSIATQAATGRLVDSPGNIRAGKRLGSQIVVYKERSMYLGTYQGAPIIWSWQLIPGEIGALSQECVVDIGVAHIFVSHDDIYLYDGSRPVSIGAPLKEWFFAGDLNQTYKYRTKGVHDRVNSVVYFFYPSKNGGGEVDSYIAYNYKSQKWGYGMMTIQVMAEYISGSVTYDTITGSWTYDTMPAIAYDSPFWLAASPILAFVNTANKVQTLTGISGSSSITTGDIGDDDLYSTLTKVRLQAIKAPTSATLTHYTRPTLGGTLVTRTSSSLTDGKFDVLWSARWHRLKIDFTGDYEITAFDPKAVADGVN